MKMVRRLGASTTSVRKSRSSSSKFREAADELAVRAYLRSVVGSPVRSPDGREMTEIALSGAIRRWSERAGVDRRTLSQLGVDRRVLDAAGLAPTRVGDVVRRHYRAEPFSVADLARRSAVSPASVRQTVYDDEESGLVEAVDIKGKTVLYRRVR